MLVNPTGFTNVLFRLESSYLNTTVPLGVKVNVLGYVNIPPRYCMDIKKIVFVGLIIGMTISVAGSYLLLNIGEKPVPKPLAGVNADINETQESITFTVGPMGDSDYVVLRGDVMTEVKVDGKGEKAAIVLDKEGQTVNLSAKDGFIKEKGSISIVAVQGSIKNTYSPVWSPANISEDSIKGIRVEDDLEEEAVRTTVQVVDYNFSE